MPELGTIGDGMMNKLSAYDGTIDEKLNQWIAAFGFPDGTVGDKIMQALAANGLSGYSSNEGLRILYASLAGVDPTTVTFNDAQRIYFNT